MTAPRPRQLTLALAHEHSYRREDFLEGAHNTEALSLIERWPNWPSYLFVLKGPAGSGKSHLVEIWRELSGARIVSGAELDGLQSRDVLATGVAAVEGVDRIGARGLVALFHLLNRAHAQDVHVLLTCQEPPEHWAAKLPDLLSRLRAGVWAHLREPDDMILRQVMVKLLADRQLEISPDVLNYCLLRMERSLQSAGRLVAALDEEAMATNTGLSKPMAARVLRRLDG